MLITSVTFSRARDKFTLISKPLEKVAPQPALGLKVHSYGNMLNFKWAKVTTTPHVSVFLTLTDIISEIFSSNSSVITCEIDGFGTSMSCLKIHQFCSIGQIIRHLCSVQLDFCGHSTVLAKLLGPFAVLLCFI